MAEKFIPSGKQLLPPVLTGSTLKWIAILTMLIDHIGAVIIELGLWPWGMNIFTEEIANQIILADKILRSIGRIAFPIFCFLLVEGFIHTHDRKKYLLRLGLFSVLSEMPFDLCFQGTFLEFSYQNVFFTLLLGLMTISLMDFLREKNSSLMILGAVPGLALGFLLRADYGWKGVLVIILFYLFRSFPLPRTIAGCISLLWEPWALLAFIPINLYNGQRGRSLKYFFYLFYPVHLLILYAIRNILFQV